MPKISVLILTHNSDKTLVRTLESVKNFDEIVIIDSGSTDLTEQIAHSYIAKFIVHRFHGFSEQRNFAISKATHEWCLFVDSDEEVTPELTKTLYEVAKLDQALPLYRVFRTEYVLNKETTTGHGQSGYQERFFKKSQIKFEGDIHEHPVINGVVPAHDSPLVGNLPKVARLNHDPNNSITTSIRKLGSYSILKAQEKIKAGRKTSMLEIFLVFNLTFIQMFFKNIREGKRGFMAGAVEAIHRTIVKLLIYEHQLIKDEEKHKKN